MRKIRALITLTITQTQTHAHACTHAQAHNKHTNNCMHLHPNAAETRCGLMIGIMEFRTTELALKKKRFGSVSDAITCKMAEYICVCVLCHSPALPKPAINKKTNYFKMRVHVPDSLNPKNPCTTKNSHCLSRLANVDALRAIPEQTYAANSVICLPSLSLTLPHTIPPVRGDKRAFRSVKKNQKKKMKERKRTRIKSKTS